MFGWFKKKKTPDDLIAEFVRDASPNFVGHEFETDDANHRIFWAGPGKSDPKKFRFGVERITKKRKSKTTRFYGFLTLEEISGTTVQIPDEVRKAQYRDDEDDEYEDEDDDY